MLYTRHFDFLIPGNYHDIKDYSAISELANPSAALLDEFLIYVHFKDEEIPTPFTVSSFWKANTNRFPHLAAVASTAIWMLVASVDVESQHYPVSPSCSRG